MLAQILTLVGTLCGALVGMAAPVFASMFARRDREVEVQRQIAADVMGLFQEPVPLSSLLVSQESLTRRKLYLLALRLTDTHAREACMKLISCAGQPDSSDDTLSSVWNEMMTRVGDVYRRTREA